MNELLNVDGRKQEGEEKVGVGVGGWETYQSAHGLEEHEGGEETSHMLALLVLDGVTGQEEGQEDAGQTQRNRGDACLDGVGGWVGGLAEYVGGWVGRTANLGAREEGTVGVLVGGLVKNGAGVGLRAPLVGVRGVHGDTGLYAWRRRRRCWTYVGGGGRGGGRKTCLTYLGDAGLHAKHTQAHHDGGGLAIHRQGRLAGGGPGCICVLREWMGGWVGGA